MPEDGASLGAFLLDLPYGAAHAEPQVVNVKVQFETLACLPSTTPYRLVLTYKLYQPIGAWTVWTTTSSCTSKTIYIALDAMSSTPTC